MNMTVKETAEWLLSRDSFLITNHLRPDGDAHGSAAALCQGLRECGKTAYILPNPDSTERYIPWVENYYPDPEEDFAPAPKGHGPRHATLDPSGARLLEEDAIAAVRDKLLPAARWITPNLPETAALLGREIRTVAEMETAAAELSRRENRTVFIEELFRD